MTCKRPPAIPEQAVYCPSHISADGSCKVMHVHYM
jgi:hypothetical protein